MRSLHSLQRERHQRGRQGAAAAVQLCSRASGAFFGERPAQSSVSRSRAQACVDVLRPLRTAYSSVLGAPPSGEGTPQLSGNFSRKQVAPALPAATLPATTPRFAVCATVAFSCTQAWNGSSCVAVRGVRTPRTASPFARLWDSRGRSSRERDNAGGRLAPGHGTAVFNPVYLPYFPTAVERLPDALGAVGNDEPGLFGNPNATRISAVRPFWQWIINASIPPPPLRRHRRRRPPLPARRPARPARPARRRCRHGRRARRRCRQLLQSSGE